MRRTRLGRDDVALSQQDVSCQAPIQVTAVGILWRTKTKPAVLDANIRAVCEDLGNECHVLLSGRITIDSSPGLHRLLLQRIESSDCQRLTVDFCDVSYVDTSGLAILVEILKTAQMLGKTLRLSRLRERPRYLLETTRLLHLFEEVNREDPCQSHSWPESPA